MKSVSPSIQFRCIVPAANWCGESPVWNSAEHSLYWVDINRRLVHRFMPENENLRTWQFEEPVTALALTSEEDVFLVALASRLVFWKPDTHSCTDAGFRLQAWPRLRFNDGRADPRGSFWVGTMWNNVQADGSNGEVGGTDGLLYRFDPGGSVSEWERGIGISNTVAWSPDGSKFYFGDTLANEVSVYDYDLKTGAITNRRPFLSGFSRGLPDGSAVDAEGCLWNCRVEGGCIARVSPGGVIDRVLEFPTPKPTSCTFGGKNLETLFVTSISLGCDGDSLAGGLFALDAGIRGLPENRFAGSLVPSP
jgi:sugar lactone lactonase YvrE